MTSTSWINWQEKLSSWFPKYASLKKEHQLHWLQKREKLVLWKLSKNKEKLNAFEIQNFFTDGYITHNNIKEDDKEMNKYKNLSKEQYYNYREILKN